MIQTIMLISAISLSQLTVKVVDQSDSNPIPQASVHVEEVGGEAKTTAPEPTDRDGQVTIPKPPFSRNMVKALKDGYYGSHKDWPFKDGDSTIPMRVRSTTKFLIPGESLCVRHRIVKERAVGPDGVARETSRIVADWVDATWDVKLQLPPDPAPPGYRYRCTTIKTWYDADIDRIMDQPIYELVPIAPRGCGYPRTGTR